jgi:predicted Zn-dependent protease
VTRSLAIAAILLAAGACATAPMTGRKQLLLLNEASEAQLGAQAYDEVKSSGKRSQNAEWTARVERVGRRIAEAANAPGFAWEFVLLEDQAVNAFCLPGGKVAFFEGIMPVCRDDTGVAVVMGHEVAHALARHGNERISQALLAECGTEAASILVGKLLSKEDARLTELAHTALGVGVQVGAILPFSRAHESEADHIGLILMAKAGYDPREAPAFWERMLAAGSDRAPEFLSTHPDPANRIEALKGWIPEALPHYEAARR